MAASLLFQALKESSPGALRELQKAIAHDAETLCRDSSGCCGSFSRSHSSATCGCNTSTGSDKYNSGSKPRCSTACMACRIFSLSHKVNPPPAPYYDSTLSHNIHGHSDVNEPSICDPTNGNAEGYVERCTSSTGTLAIDCVSLACATFPRLSPLLPELWEQSSTRLWVTPPSKAEQETQKLHGVAWVECWWLQPNERLSNELKLWGNAALTRGHTIAAQALYSAALAVFPRSSSNSSNGNLLAVLHANRSLALLRLGRVAAALRAATEATAADPTYCKAWYRRAAALDCLRELLERRCMHECATSSTLSSASSSENSYKQIIDLELTEARRIAQGGATTADAVAAAKRMSVGTCGCDASSACGITSDCPSPGSAARRWLREDIEIKETVTGWGLVRVGGGRKGGRKDPCLVLEEDAFAVFVHPNQCANIPKLPFSPTISSHQPRTDCMQLHADPAVRAAWEERIEAFTRDTRNEPLASEVAGESGVPMGSPKTMEGVCAGCATVPSRGEAITEGVSSWSLELWQMSLHHLLTPTVPVVPCGACARAFFCCELCKATSSHEQVCRQQQQEDLSQEYVVGVLQQQTDAGGSEVCEGQEATKPLKADKLVQPLALALQDPHRHIARQLLNSILPPPDFPGVHDKAGIPDHCERVDLNTCSIDVASGVSLLEEPTWRQVLRRTATVILERTRLTDWLLNAAWLAGEAFATGQGKQCGGRCAVCFPVTGASSLPNASAAAASCPSVKRECTAAATATFIREETDQVCSSCCRCCRAWCSVCSSSPSLVGEARNQSDAGAFFPRCLYAAALHAYGVACCNTFTIRVSCDPEEEAVAAGTAFFLAASLLNHSCAPNAIVAFGEPRYQLPQQHSGTRWPQTTQEGRFIPTPHTALGRGTLLQVRLCRPDELGVKSIEEEVYISYGPLVGLENSAWGHRQDWLLRNAGFYCHCEACAPSAAAPAPLAAGMIAFGREFICGSPCPICTSLPQVQQLLESVQDDGLDGDALLGIVAVLRRCLSSRLKATVMPRDQHRQQQQHQLPIQFAATSIYCEMPAETARLVLAFAELLPKDLVRQKARRRWTATRTLALLGHSCVSVWSYAGCGYSKASGVISSFLDTTTPLHVCGEFRCLHCGSLFPAVAIEKRKGAVQARLDHLRSILGSLVTPSSSVSEKRRHELLTKASQELMQVIPSAVGAGGFLSMQVWQALQAAARAAHAAGTIARRLYGEADISLESLRLAAICLSAGIHVLLQRLPLGVAQPEVQTHMYKAALLQSHAADIARAKQLLSVALKATRDSCGPYSVNHCSVKEHLEWMGSDI